MPNLNLNHVRYYYEMSGHGEPLVLLHGFTGSTESWLPHIHTFDERFRVITVDLPGHGKTESPPDPECYGMDACSVDLLALFQELGLSPVNLLGYSMGGRLALYLTLNHPGMVKRLILESASPGLRTAAERQDRVNNDRRLASEIERDGIEAFVKRWEQLPLFSSQVQLPEAVRMNLRRQRLRNNPPGLANSLRGMGTGAQPSLWSCLQNLELSLLLMVGERDRKFLKIGKDMIALVPDPKMKIVQGAGHTIHLERPGLFSEIVLDFLSDRDVIT